MKHRNSCIDLNINNSSKGENILKTNTRLFHDLMPFKVREILLVSSIYDAFIVEEEGLISELVIWEYRHLLLSSPPRVTHVKSGKEAIIKAKSNKYDLIITMSKNIGMNPFDFGKQIKKFCKDIPIIILATDNADLHFCQQNISTEGIDKAFFWYGDASLFLAIIKYVEDYINAPYDTENASVQIILYIEDNIRDYSSMLPVIYSEIVKQTQRSISDDLNEMQRLSRRKARPKIILAENYEEGIELYNKYKKNILGIISDVKYPKNGKINTSAGIDFIRKVKKNNPTVPVVLQSTNSSKRLEAEKIGSYFIYKKSPDLMKDFNKFLLEYLGFGDFIFLENLKDKKNKIKEIGRASNLREFEIKLQNIPISSIRFHSNRNDFSKWLMARCEFKLAKKLRPQKVSDFKTIDEMRKYLIKVFNDSRREKQLAVMTDFSEQKFEFDSSYTKIGSDSLGGKGRGIAFLRTLLSRTGIQKKYDNINITVPSSIAIGTDQFDIFIDLNNLQHFKNEKINIPDKKIAEIFKKAKIPDDLKQKLKIVIKNFKKPLAVRSSSLLEDSQNHPFAGLYSTYMLPNNNKDENKRLNQLCEAIKLIYASVFYKESKIYIRSTSAKIDEEKMAIIIQELIGDEYNGWFFPTISGVAQSYNFYPISYQKREEGIVSLAVGLGYSVVGGEKNLKFSPKYPQIIPDFSSTSSILKNSQKELYVLNTKKVDIKLSEKEESTLEKINIFDISKFNILNNIASTYDRNDDMIRDYLLKNSPILITFAGILKHNAIPLSEILNDLLEEGKNTIGTEIEIEFSVNFDPKNIKKPVFAIIQIRPLVISKELVQVKWDETRTKKEKILIKSNKSLGNGVIENIKNIIYVKPDKFDPSKTIQIAREISNINKKLEKKPYILIGPGRWGTQDKHLGIPIKWSDISNVKIIVETNFRNFNIKPSQGTHFFQNIISKEVGYINTDSNNDENYIDWDWLKNLKTDKNQEYTTHVILNKPINVKLDGRFGRALILKN
jgi:CheY-like chemotaxis protein